MSAYTRAIISIGAAFEELNRGLGEACRAFEEMCSVLQKVWPLRVGQLTSAGHFMYRVALWFGMSEGAAVTWCEQFPGAFTTDFGDGWE